MIVAAELVEAGLSFDSSESIRLLVLFSCTLNGLPDCEDWWPRFLYLRFSACEADER